MTLSRTAVALQSVSKTYAGTQQDVPVLRDITVGFQQGALTAIMGPSGSGKTTLLHAAAGLDRPSSGRVLLGDTDLGSMSERELTRLRRRRIGFVFQQFNLLPMLTVSENVALAMRVNGRHPRRAEVTAALQKVGLADHAGRRPAELSGGQQQRVAIARTLIAAPEVVFADEPTGSLDRRTGRQIMALLRDLADRDGRTVVMVTHDPAAAAWADRVLFLVDGRLAGSLDAPTADSVAAALNEWDR